MEPNSEQNTKPADNASQDGIGRILEKETLGEHLRKVRIGNRVDLQKMAKDTRLNLDYLTAIEKNEFDKIPGETYRKIFIKSVAKYLELLPEEIYARYLRESHPPEPAAPAPGTGLLKPREPEQKTSETHSSSPKSMQPLLITLGIVFIVLLLILSKSDKKTTVESLPAAASLQETQTQTAPSPASMDTSGTTPQSRDTARQLHEAPMTSPPPEIQEDSGGLQRKKRFADEKKGALKVELSCGQDSVYVYAWRNKRFWYNLLKQGDYKVFASDSALFFRLTPAANAIIKVNGRDYAPAPGKTEPVIRVDSMGLTYHPASLWETLNKKR